MSNKKVVGLSPLFQRGEGEIFKIPLAFKWKQISDKGICKKFISVPLFFLLDLFQAGFQVPGTIFRVKL